MIEDAIDQAAKLNRVHFYIVIINEHTVYSTYRVYSVYKIGLSRADDNQ